MKRFLLALSLWLGLAPLAFAQVTTYNGGCTGASGINSVPQSGRSCPTDSIAPTFGATAIGLVPASSATDIACLTGNATTVTRLQGIRISGTAGTLVSLPIVIVKRASIDTGGTAATSTALPVAYRYDPLNPAPLSSTTAYTANPTIVDTSPGILDAAVLTLNVTTAAGGAFVNFNWLTRAYNEAPVLRSAAQQICVNLNGISVSSGLIAVSFIWTEQSS